MKTKAVRLYGERDLRLEAFELPALRDDEILARVVSDSICMSSYKAAMQGTAHKRIPADAAQNPVIIGHEFCGELVDVGAKWAGRYKAGDKFVIQPALNYKGSLDAPGYSYRFVGGNATYVIMPNEVMEMNCLLHYNGAAWYMGSLAEPLSCVIGACHASYHTTPGSYEHTMGIRPGGKAAILAGLGPMGLALVDYLIHCDKQPSLLVVTDIDEYRLTRAAEILDFDFARKRGMEIKLINTAQAEASERELRALAPEGYDDVFVFAPVAPVVEQGDRLLARDGCLNFFAGPADSAFSAKLNFYNVHYNAAHLTGTSGGNIDDMLEAVDMIGRGLLNPSILVTHIGGLDAVIGTTLNLPHIPGGKKLIYTHISLPLTAIANFAQAGQTDPLFARLAEITSKTQGLWNPEAEEYLLANAASIDTAGTGKAVE